MDKILVLIRISFCEKGNRDVFSRLEGLSESDTIFLTVEVKSTFAFENQMLPFEGKPVGYGYNSSLLKYLTILLMFSCRSIPYFETSAANGQNVDKAVETLLDLIMKRMEQCVDKSQLSDTANGGSSGKLVSSKSDEKKCAC